MSPHWRLKASDKWSASVEKQTKRNRTEWDEKTIKTRSKIMTQWNRERIGTVFDPVSVKNQTSICSREGFGEHTGSRFRKRIRNMSHFLWSMSALQHWSGSDDQELCLFIPVSVEAAMQPRHCNANPSENASLATFMVMCAAFCVNYHVIVSSVQLYLHRDAHQQESCSIVFVSAVGDHM